MFVSGNENVRNGFDIKTLNKHCPLAYGFLFAISYQQVYMLQNTRS
jgi:hypothetical protein